MNVIRPRHRRSAFGYDALILRSNPFAYYRLNEPVGTSGAGSVKDSSGNGRHATPSSGITFGQPGILVRDGDPCIKGDGTSNSTIVYDEANMLTSYPFTFEGWFKASGTENGVLYFLGDKDVDNQYFYSNLETNGNVRLATRNTTAIDTFSSGTDFSDASLHHSVMVCRGATDFELFIDDVSEVTQSTSVSAVNDADRLAIGHLARSSPAAFANYLMSKIAFYDFELSAAVITAHFEAGS